LALTWRSLVGRIPSLGGDDRTRTVTTVHSFPRDFRLQFWVGLWTPNLGEGEAVGDGSWYRSKERWWVLCRPSKSIVTFPLFTHCRDIATFVHQHAPFSYPTSSLPKFPHVRRGVGGSPVRYKEQKCSANCLCNYSKFSNLCDHVQSTNVTDERTQTDRRHAIARLRFALKCIVR